jgi:hypothetical protein
MRSQTKDLVALLAQGTLCLAPHESIAPSTISGCGLVIAHWPPTYPIPRHFPRPRPPTPPYLQATCWGTGLPDSALSRAAAAAAAAAPSGAAAANPGAAAAPPTAGGPPAAGRPGSGRGPRPAAGNSPPCRCRARPRPRSGCTAARREAAGRAVHGRAGHRPRGLLVPGSRRAAAR